MTYEDLLKEAESHGLIIKEKPLRAYKGRIKGNRIAIKKDLNNTDKKCTLIEEIGHYHTTVGNILDQSDVRNRKQEKKARRWAYERCVGLIHLVQASKEGIRNAYELAEYLGVTEELLNGALNYYKEKYGLYYVLDKYIIYFDPLSVFEIWG